MIPNLQGGFVDNCREIVRRMIFHDVNPVMYNWIMIILRPRFDRGCFFFLWTSCCWEGNAKGLKTETGFQDSMYLCVTWCAGLCVRGARAFSLFVVK